MIMIIILEESFIVCRIYLLKIVFEKSLKPIYNPERVTLGMESLSLTPNPLIKVVNE